MVFAPSYIGCYVHYSVTFHFIERKSIIHCTNTDGCFQASMTRGRRGVNTCIYCFSGCHTSGAKTKEKTFVLKHTHAYRLHIGHLVSHMYVLGARPHRADTAVSDKPKAQKAHIHIQLSV